MQDIGIFRPLMMNLVLVMRTSLKVLQLIDAGISPVLSWWQVSPVTELDHDFTDICQACLKTHRYPWKALF